MINKKNGKNKGYWDTFSLLSSSAVILVIYKGVCMETRLGNIFKTTNILTFTKVILEISLKGKIFKTFIQIVLH